jgi:hypothetical protein
MKEVVVPSPTSTPTVHSHIWTCRKSRAVLSNNLKNEYKPIFDFIINENLFINIPNSNDIEINDNLSTRLWLVDGYTMVNFIEK